MSWTLAALFSYPFQDADWLKKLGIAALVIAIPLVGPIVAAGWGLEIMRRVILDDPTPLPDWGDFGTLAVNGLKGAVVQLAYGLPLVLVIGCWRAAQFRPDCCAGRLRS